VLKTGAVVSIRTDNRKRRLAILGCTGPSCSVDGKLGSGNVINARV